MYLYTKYIKKGGALEIEKISIEDIHEYENNAKLHPQEQIEQIKKSIELFGFNDPIAVDENNMIIEGHGRFEACKQLGMEEVPVIKLLHLSEEEKKSYILVHNKITMNTKFDIDLLNGELNNILSFDLSDFNFNHDIDLFDEEVEVEVEVLEEEGGGNYKNAPLPFQGQKRNSVEKFCEMIEEFYDDTYIFVDLFGGSGLLSRNIKRVLPNAEVYYNDFDDYVLRCKNVDTTNKILEEVSSIMNIYEVEKFGKLNNTQKKKIINIFRSYEDLGHELDYVTLSGSLLFTGCYALTLEEFKKNSLHNRVRKKKFNPEHVKNFHKDLKITKLDWHENFNNWKDNPKVVFIADPPYLATDVSSYSESENWDIATFLKINDALKDYNQVFFTSDKSNIMILDKFLKEKNYGYFFQNEVIHTNVVSTGRDSKYNDYMVFSFKGTHGSIK